MNGEDRPEEQAKRPLNPSTMSLVEAAAVLTQAGMWEVTPEDVAGDLADGAPTNPDGTINLIHYAAWLAGELNRAD